MNALLAFLKTRSNHPVVILLDDVSRLARDIDCQRDGCESRGKSINRDQLHSEFEGIIQGLQPRLELVAMTKAKSDIVKLDKQVSGLLDHIVDATKETVISAYEKCVTGLEREKQLFLESSAQMAELHTG